MVELSKLREEKQQLLDRQAANPRERFNERERNLIRAAEDECMVGVVESIETEPKKKRGPKKKAAASAVATTNVAAPIASTSATTAAGRLEAVPRKRAAQATIKTITKAATATTLKNTIVNKRKSKDEEDTPPTKRPRGRPKKASKPKVVINEAPTQRLDVYVFGEGSGGELGLGSTGRVTDVQRPRLNPKLSAADVGVVQLAAGGMHAVALTHDNKILTWGVNDQGALGRDTTHQGKLRDIDADSNEEDDDDDDYEDDNSINPRESTPTEVSLENVPAGTVFTQIAAGDNITLAVTDDGLVYACGTFRSNDGNFNFTPTIPIQPTLLPLPGLTSITHVCCGDNHALALSASGAVHAWGSSEQHQLGRRIMARTHPKNLVPRALGLPKHRAIAAIACGAYHSFAIERAGAVWAWGLNSYGQTGLADGAGGDDTAVRTPTRVAALAGKRRVVTIAGGAQHSIAVTAEDEALVWGRVDGARCGIPVASMAAADVVRDPHGTPRILLAPMPLQGVGSVLLAAVGTDSSIVVNALGSAFSWGFSAGYQTGLGTTADVLVPTRIENTAVRGRRIVWAGAGGQFGMLAAEAEAEGEAVEGVSRVCGGGGGKGGC
ncbi:hypothetical protein MMC17_005607 [Xylographa soralifera]|nr:hypothetical protein [Xylographa soralifera]